MNDLFIYLFIFFFSKEENGERETCSRGDADKAGDHALNSTNDRRLLEEDNIKPGPDEEAGGGTDVGVENCHGGVGVSCVRVSSVEPCPSQPQQPRPSKHQQHIVWWKPLPVPFGSWPHLYTSHHLPHHLHRPIIYHYQVK